MQHQSERRPKCSRPHRRQTGRKMAPKLHAARPGFAGPGQTQRRGVRSFLLEPRRSGQDPAGERPAKPTLWLQPRTTDGARPALFRVSSKVDLQAIRVPDRRRYRPALIHLY